MIVQFLLVCMSVFLSACMVSIDLMEPRAVGLPSSEQPSFEGVPLFKTLQNVGTQISEDTAFSIFRQTDGKTLVAGFNSFSGTGDFIVLRYNADFTLDTGFGDEGTVRTDFGVGKNDAAFSVRQLSNGRIVVAGFTNFGGSNNFALVSLNADGSVDTSFGTDGKVVTDIGTNSHDQLSAMEVQSDGKIVLVGTTDAVGPGNDFVAVRFNPDGTLDSGFGGAGKSIVDMNAGSADHLHTMALQADGKIILGGTATIGASTDFIIARLNTDGSVDNTFGTAGRVFTDLNGNSPEAPSSIAIQADGKILMAGWSGWVRDFALVRYTTTGALDATFGAGGVVLTNLGGAGDTARSVVVQGDGKIVAGGYSNASGNNDFALVRYSSTGAVDMTFGTAGITTLNFVGTGDDQVIEVKILPDGSFVAIGDSDISGSRDFSLAKFTSSGALDATFGIAGKITREIGAGDSDMPVNMRLQADGKTVFVGWNQSGGVFHSFVSRINKGGTIDAAFGSKGSVMLTAITNLTDVEIQSDGKIVAVGYVPNGPNYDMGILRLNSDGTFDASFGTGGIVVLNITGTSKDLANAVTIQSDGKIVLGGSSGVSNTFVVVRLNANGSLDNTFGTGGAASGTNFTVTGVAVLSDGKVVVMGSSTSGPNEDFGVMRFSSAGVLDVTFGTGGVGSVDINAGSADSGFAAEVQADGKIVVTGLSGDDFGVARFNPDGSVDTGFGTNGVRFVDIDSGSDDYPGNRMAIQSDGKILMSGYTYGSDPSYDLAVVRFNVDGSLDAGFGSGGQTVIDVGGDSDDNHLGVLVEEDGHILVGGFTDYSIGNYIYDIVLMRLNSDGTE